MQYILTNDQYAIIEKFFPRNTNKKKAGRPPKIDDRITLEGILYILSTGCQWRKLPSCYGKWHTTYTRYVRWMSAGVFGQILLALQKIRKMDVRIIFLDSTTVRAHPCASGAQKKRGPKHFEDQGDDSLQKFTHLR